MSQCCSLSVGGGKFSEQELYDSATNFIRTQLASVQGASIPLPYGGKTELYRWTWIPTSCRPITSHRKRLPTQSIKKVILPSGTAKIGKREYDVLLNRNTDTIQALNNLPIKQENGATTYIRDVANVRDGYTPQVNMVLANGIKAALLSVLSLSAETLTLPSSAKPARGPGDMSCAQ
jgi:Cu/Ag efflux pump CusA